MDIRQWLEETADHAPPDPESALGLPAYLQPHTEPEHHSRKYRRRRKQSSADSSIIEARQPEYTNRKATNNAHPREQTRGAEDESRNSQSSRLSALEEISQRAYEKRARHKTRPDYYEPKTKERRKKGKKRKEDEEREDRQSKPKRRKSHRSGDGGRTSGLVQSFQLRNGPKNNRLTLKPDATAGLFKHGRASAQVTGRGGGLPDLAFNEMRFLQRPNDHQDEPQEDRNANPKTKKDRGKQRDHEISAYFAAQGPSVQHNDDSLPSPETRAPQVTARRTRSELQRANRRVAEPPVDLPDKPFLGFGSRGFQQESKDTQLPSNSHYTWSESVAPQANVMPVLNGSTGAPVEREPTPKLPDRQPENVTPATHTVFERRTPDLNNNLGSGNWLQSRRTRGPAVVEVYQSLARPTHDERRNRRSVTKTTLQSLPRQPSSELSKAKTADGVQNQQRIHNHRTSDILDVHDQLRSRTRQPRRDDHRVNSPIATEKENRDPDFSTPTSKFLRYAREAVEQVGGSTIPAAPPRVQSRSHVMPHPNGHPFPNERLSAPVMGIPGTLRDVRSHAGDLRERRLESASSMRQKERSTPRYPVQAQWQHRPLLQQDRNHYVLQAVADEDDEMLDNQPDLATCGLEVAPVYDAAHQAEELVHEDFVDQTSGLYEAQAEACEVGEVLSDASQSHKLASNRSAEYLSAAIPLYHDVMSTGGKFRSERSAIFADKVGVGTSDELAGFWKPHVLY